MELFVGPNVEALIDLALEEDQVGYDVTSAAFFDVDDRKRARLVAKEPFVMAGAPVAKAVFERVDSDIDWEAEVAEGQSVEPGDVVARLAGPVVSLLGAERTALNFLQRMCGVATITEEHVRAAGDADLCVVDTRKTLPGWRLLDKYAVRCGGGHNHRFNLAGGVMLKENHIAAADSIADAVERVRDQAPHTLRVEVEVEELDEVRQAVDAGADIIMLDNMDNDELRRAVEVIRNHQRGSQVVIEASGNMDQQRLATLEGIGLDVVSVGALTHSATAADISMRLQGAEVGDDR